MNPPIIEGTLPAFYSDSEGATLVVPFAMNRAVSPNEIAGFAAKVKTVQSNTFILSLATNDYDLNKGEIYFHINPNLVSEKLNIGQFYKVQVAYGGRYDENSKVLEEVGVYSTVAIVKFTAKPIVEINGLESNNAINMHNYFYVGHFAASSLDTTERAYSYNFKVWDWNNDLLYDTGEIVHDSSTDITAYESFDEFHLKTDLKVNYSYYIQYTVTTMNKMVIKSPRYRIMQKNSIDPELEAKLIATLNFDNGYINLTLDGAKDPETNLEIAATGSFLLTRSSDQDNYQTWNEVLRFTLQGQPPSRWLWKDRTIEQGVTYIYALQQYNDAGLYSNRQLSNKVYGDFEDSFLLDGDRQLKIRFNPKVSSFKKNILETKVDTLGGKHPFIFRNGTIEYREFPISGLISYWSDEEEMFMDKDNLYNISPTTNLISENLTAERLFKMEVLDWLTNGKPKLFRSPGEGCFIVRLMNSSLSPNDATGRMLHTFTSTAYEIADFTFENLASYGFLQTTDPTTIQRRWETVEFETLHKNTGFYYDEYPKKNIQPVEKYDKETDTTTIVYPLPDDVTFYILNNNTYIEYTGIYYPDNKVLYTRVKGWKQINKYPVLTAHFIDMLPGDQVRIDGEIFIIGSTGGYYIDLGRVINLIEIAGTVRQGSLTYGYESVSQNVFDTVQDIQIIDIPSHMFIGAHDILNEINDVKVQIQNLYGLHAWARPMRTAYLIGNQLYTDAAGKYPIERSLLYVYYVIKENTQINGCYYAPQTEADLNQTFPADGSIPRPSAIYTVKQFNNYLYFNGSQVDVGDIQEYTVEDINDITEIISGPGLITELTYQKSILEYQIEDNDIEITSKKDYYMMYQNAINDALALLLNDKKLLTVQECIEQENIIKNNIPYRDYWYKIFVEALAEGLEEIKREKSIT